MNFTKQNLQTGHEAFNSVILKMLGDICYDLQSSHVSQITECLQKIPKSSLAANYLALIKDLSKGCRDPQQKVCIIITQS